MTLSVHLALNTIGLFVHLLLSTIAVPLTPSIDSVSRNDCIAVRTYRSKILLVTPFRGITCNGRDYATTTTHREEADPNPPG